MEQAILLDANDIKKIIAEKFGVDEKDVIKNQYTYTIKGVTKCDATEIREGTIDTEEETAE